MRAPEAFAYAFSGLQVILVDYVPGGFDEADLRREAFRWMREDARGSLALCKAAIFAMRHEAAAGGLVEDAEAARATVRALGVIKRALDPQEEGASPTADAITPTPTRVPDALKERAPNVKVFRMGKGQILAEPGGAAGSGGWHISVTHPERFPTLRELMAAGTVAGGNGTRFAALLPDASAPTDGRGVIVHLVEARPESGKSGG